MTQIAKQSLDYVLKKHRDWFRERDYVSAVAPGKLSTGRRGIKVYVEELTPEVEAEMPKELDGYPVELKEIGRFVAFQQE